MCSQRDLRSISCSDFLLACVAEFRWKPPQRATMKKYSALPALTNRYFACETWLLRRSSRPQADIEPAHTSHDIVRFDPESGCLQASSVKTPTRCLHVARIRCIDPSRTSCEDCVKTREAWLQLRMCLECGHVGCCDSSKNKHATAHFRGTGHPLARSIEPGEEWVWCYVDRLWFEKLLT